MNQQEMEHQHSMQMNQQAVEQIKQDAAQQDRHLAAKQVEKIFFEDDAEIMLRDGKTYKIPPCTLKDARKLMSLLQTVSIDAIILNLLPADDGSQKPEQDLFDILGMAFQGYPHLTREYLDEHVDLATAKKIIEIMIGLNGLKK